MRVLIKFSGDTRQVITLDKRSFFIGSAAENDIALPGSRAPEIAGKIECGADEVRIEALKSGSILVNGKKISAQALRPGDRIETGSAVMVFDQCASEPPAGSGKSSLAVLDSLARFTEAVGKERDLKKLLRKIIDSLYAVIGGEEAFVLVLDAYGKPQIFVASPDGGGAQERFSDTIVQGVIKEKKGIVIANALTDQTFAGAHSIADLRLTSVLCSPMLVADRLLGVIYIGSKRIEISFTADNLETLRLYALIAGMLINHVDFISQQNATIKRLSDMHEEGGIIAESPVMKKVLGDIGTVARSDIPVLLNGETGTGKDVMAELIHRKSDRKNAPFVPVNCSSLRGELLESELFGHKQGAFTGAVRDHRGLFFTAHKGTLFLDEISEMELPLQAKLLRTLESGRIRAVGSSTEESVDVRIICATNRDLKTMIAEGAFRQDLFFRLHQYAIQLPPLRERGADITLLAYHFLEKFTSEYPAREIVDFHPDALKAMLLYDWPGNVRELSSVVHKAVLASAGPLAQVDIDDRIAGREINFDEATRQFQLKLIKRGLDACSGNREQAARTLGMSRSNFFRYLAELKG
jgi:transcriptional regulator with GAF, ATPase, and Fis domain